MNEKAWTEVTYYIVITEERTVRLPLPDNYNNTSTEALHASCMKEAINQRAEAICKTERMKITKISSQEPKILRVIYADENGKPSPYNVYEFEESK